MTRAAGNTWTHETLGAVLRRWVPLGTACSVLQTDGAGVVRQASEVWCLLGIWTLLVPPPKFRS